MATDRFWKQELKDLMRAVAAGSLFGMPLLFTMEVWEQGAMISSSRLLALLGVTFFINLVGCLVWGIREDNSLFGAFADALTAVGTSLVLCAGVLYLIGRLNLEQDLMGSLGKIILATVVVSVGITFVSNRFREEANGHGDLKAAHRHGKSEDELASLQFREDIIDLAGSVAGALIFSFNIAPTEEIMLIASGLGSGKLLVLLISEFALCYIILFASGLWKRDVYVQDGLFQKPWAETTMAFAIAVLVSATLLFFVGYPGVTDNTSVFIANLVTLLLPATVGAAGGRIAV